MLKEEIRYQMEEMFFPYRYCLICNKKKLGRSTPIKLCPDCLRKLLFMDYKRCPHCGYFIGKDEEICSNCKNVPLVYLRSITSLIPYRGTFRDNIIDFKYNADVYSGKYLGQMMAFFLENMDMLEDIDVIVPVPAHKYRLQQRGYNQVEVLGGHLSRFIGKPQVPHALVRLKNAPTQTNLTREERFGNALNAYARGPEFKQVRGKNILLIDDVVTTGATLNACSQLLYFGGANGVYAMTLAGGID